MRIYNETYLFNYIKHINNKLIHKKNLSLILFYIYFSQSICARKYLYLRLCYVSRMNKMKERAFIKLIILCWKHSIFSTSSRNDKKFLASLEVKMKNSNIFGFSTNYFYKSSKDYTHMLTKKSMVLRIDFYTFVVFWDALEAYRSTMYNSHLESNAFLNRTHNFVVKYRYRQFRKLYKLIRITARKLIAENFIISLHQDNFKIIKTYHGQTQNVFGLNDNVSKVVYKMVKNTYIYNKLYPFVAFPVATTFTKKGYFEKYFHAKGGAMANFIFCHFPNTFPKKLIRIDYIKHYMVFHLFSMYRKKKIFSTFIKLYAIHKILNDWVGEFTNSRSKGPFGYYLLADFIKLDKPIAIDHTYRFTYYVWKFFIGEYLNKHVLEKLYFSTYYTFGTRFSRRKSRLLPADILIFLESYMTEIVCKYVLFNNLHCVEVALSRSIIGVEYLKWKIVNADAELRFLKGRLDFPYLLRKIDLDNVYTSRFSVIWSMVYKYLKNRKFFNISGYKTHFFKTNIALNLDYINSFTNFVSSNELFWADSDSSVRYLKGFISSKKYMRIANIIKQKTIFRFTKRMLAFNPLLKLSSFILSDSIEAIIFKFLYRSNKLSFLCHFLLLKNLSHKDKLRESISELHSNIWFECSLTYQAWCHWLHIYRTALIKYNRLRKRNVFMSLTNPIFKEKWLRFYHRMRRSGIKVKTDLPFYVTDAGTDYIKELKKVKHFKQYSKFNNKWWIIY